MSKKKEKEKTSLRSKEKHHMNKLKEQKHILALITALTLPPGGRFSKRNKSHFNPAKKKNDTF